MKTLAPTDRGEAIPAAMIEKSTGRVMALFDTWPKAGDHMIAPVFKAVIPEGMHQVGDTMYRFTGSHVNEIVMLEEDDEDQEDG